MPVARSKVSICNMALVHLGNPNFIMDLDNDGTKESNSCNVAYDVVRQSLLRAHPWNFATKRQQLAQLVTAPAFEFSYQYELPSDCLKVRKIYYDYGKTYKIEGRMLLTDLDAVNLIYTADIDDPMQFDSVFVELFALALAAKLSVMMTGSVQLSQEQKQEFDRLFAWAKQYNGQEGIPDQIPEGDWIDWFLVT